MSSSDVPPHDRPAPLPRWVPIVIGVVLVTIASLAVITGLRYRDQTLVQMVKPRAMHPRSMGAAPPGEPEAGASLVSAGVPAANEPEEDGQPMTARRGLQVKVTPDDALVYINNVPVGMASQFDSENEIYDFAAPGSYTVRLVAPGFKERQYIITVQDAAKEEIARIAAKLEKQ